MIGERLQEIRRDHGDTQQSLAAKLRVSKPTVQAWELGKSSPGHDMLVTICRMYEVSSDYLLGLTDTDPAYIKRRQRNEKTNAVNNTNLFFIRISLHLNLIVYQNTNNLYSFIIYFFFGFFAVATKPYNISDIHAYFLDDDNHINVQMF